MICVISIILAFYIIISFDRVLGKEAGRTRSRACHVTPAQIKHN